MNENVIAAIITHISNSSLHVSTGLNTCCIISGTILAELILHDTHHETTENVLSYSPFHCSYEPAQHPHNMKHQILQKKLNNALNNEVNCKYSTMYSVNNKKLFQGDEGVH